MGKRLVLVGGGHAHMMTMENINKFVDKGFKVTVIGPSFSHYYSGMGPGMLGGTYTPEDIRFATKDVVEKQGGIFVKDKVIKIDPEKKLVYMQEGQTLSYDVLSFNAGSYVPMQAVSENRGNVYSVKPIERLMEAAIKLKVFFAQKKLVVSIVGGGPSSAEVAGNVWQLAKKANRYMPVIRIFAGIKGIDTKNNAISKTRVVQVHSDKVIDSEGRINQQLLQQMIDNGIRELSSRNNLVEAWSRYYKDTDVIGMKSFTQGFSALRAGFMPGSLQGHALQLGGAVVVVPEGKITYVFKSSAAGDHPPVEALLAAAG